MKELPISETYEQELLYMPYKKSLAQVLETICAQAPVNGTLLDLMCGPGYLLGQIAEKRKDLHLLGVDSDARYVDFSKAKYPGIDFEVGDILAWKPKELFDVVICTGSVHHIPYEKQDEAVARIASMVKPGGFCIISDCHIDDYSNEQERKLAAAKLGYEYLRATIANGAPEDVVAATIDILHNDVMMDEFKTSVERRMPVYQKYFSEVELSKTWPDTDSQYGDYYVVCKGALTTTK
ncbi:class I SAM-dependent methyltransferase [Patescibacteria group bacterium]|nr:MAG: class I SAM-dependent methyltransferase [Patescibacteria group bacterium]